MPSTSTTALFLVDIGFRRSTLSTSFFTAVFITPNNLTQLKTWLLYYEACRHKNLKTGYFIWSFDMDFSSIQRMSYMYFKKIIKLWRTYRPVLKNEKIYQKETTLFLEYNQQSRATDQPHKPVYSSYQVTNWSINNTDEVN